MKLSELLSVSVIAFCMMLGYVGTGYEYGNHVTKDPFFNETETKPHMISRHNTLANGVLGSYAVAAVLFVMYLYEDAPWHKTQMREHAYLSFILAMVFSARCLLWWDPMHGIQRRRWDKMQHLMMATLVVRISTFMTGPTQADGFFKHRCNAAGSFFELHRPKRTLKATRVVSQLDQLVNEVLALQSGSFAQISNTLFMNSQLFLFILQNIMVLSPHLFHYADPIIYSWWIILWAMLLNDTIKVWFRVRPRQQLINTLVGSILEDGELCRYVLWSMSLATLMEVGTASTVEMISRRVHRAGHLGVIEKAMVIDAMQKRGIRLWKEQQSVVVELLLSCQGEELTLLKNLIDSGGDYYNLYKLVYEDITDRESTQAILRHLRAEALPLRRSKGARQGTSGGVGIKVLSDVDDTLYSSGGSFPAGCDKSFPKHRVYPGCLELFKVLDWSHDPATPSCNIVFLSARPHVYKYYMEDHSYQLFRSLLADSRMHSLPTLLPGALRQGIQAMLFYACRGTRAWKGVGELKYTTFKKYTQLYLEYDYVFCGDNGQGDLLAGQLMTEAGAQLSESESESLDEERVDPQPQVLAVLVHEVMPNAKALAQEPPAPSRRGPDWRQALRARGVFLHRTYVGAAVQLYESVPGLVSPEALRQVTESAVQHFEADVRYCEWRGNWEEAAEALRQDVERAVAIVARAGLRPIRGVREVPALLPRMQSSGSFCASEPSDAGSDDESEDRLLME